MVLVLSYSRNDKSIGLDKGGKLVNSGEVRNITLT